MPRYRDPQLQVGENYSNFPNSRQNIYNFYILNTKTDIKVLDYFNIVGVLRDREVACSTSPRTSRVEFEYCVWRAVSFHSSLHPQEVLLAKFSLYVHKGGLKPHIFHLILLDLFRLFSSLWLVQSCVTMMTLLHNYYFKINNLVLHLIKYLSENFCAVKRSLMLSTTNSTKLLLVIW